MNALESGKPEMIVTAQHWLPDASGERRSCLLMRHWIEIVEQALVKRNNKMKTKVIPASKWRVQLLPQVRKRRRKTTGLFPLLLPMIGGHLLALSRMDDCAPIAAYISRRKRVPPRWGVVKLKGSERW